MSFHQVTYGAREKQPVLTIEAAEADDDMKGPPVPMVEFGEATPAAQANVGTAAWLTVPVPPSLRSYEASHCHGCQARRRCKRASCMPACRSFC